MILSAPFAVSLTLAAPPPTLTIFSVNAYLRQTTTSLPKDGTPRVIQGARRYIVREGMLGAYSDPGWAARARAGKGAPGSTGIILDSRREGAAESGFWRFTKVGRLVSARLDRSASRFVDEELRPSFPQPCDSTLRPSTLPGTVTSLRFSSQLVVDVVFTEESSDPAHDGRVKIATLYDREVHISS